MVSSDNIGKIVQVEITVVIKIALFGELKENL